MKKPRELKKMEDRFIKTKATFQIHHLKMLLEYR
jgi:hypothetical protein